MQKQIFLCKICVTFSIIVVSGPGMSYKGDDDTGYHLGDWPGVWRLRGKDGDDVDEEKDGF
jgi:hypothetical protein